MLGSDQDKLGPWFILKKIIIAPNVQYYLSLFYYLLMQMLSLN